MAFSKLFGIFTYSEDLTGFKEKALMSSGLRKSLMAMAVLGCCSGGTIAAACNNSWVNSEVTEQVDKPQKDKQQIIAEICKEGLEKNTLSEPGTQSACTKYVAQHKGAKPEKAEIAPQVMVV